MSSVEPKWVVLLALLTHCAPQIPPEYARHEGAAEAATARGDHASAAAQYAKAAEVADTEVDRSEALYRQATSALRAGDARQHERILTALSRTPGSRRERAVYDLATSEFARDPVSGARALRAAIVAYPASGLAKGALDRLLASSTPERRVATLSELSAQVSAPELRERILVLQARALEASGHTDDALRVYERQVRDFPYPRGQYWDESLLRQAVIWLSKGDRVNASKVLEHLLSFREQATVVGSYDRHYAEATLLLAYVWLDERWTQAYTLLHEFPERHPDSRKRDEAVWAALLLAQAHGRADSACDDAALLSTRFEESRYAPCVTEFCPSVTSSGTCRSYVLRDRGSARASLEAALADVLATPR